MDKLNELKEKQQEIGDKISLLRETNKKKDEEANEIRKLIAECRENLNRIKNISPGTDTALLPCPDLDALGEESAALPTRRFENLGQQKKPSKKDVIGGEEFNSKFRASKPEDASKKGPCRAEKNKIKCRDRDKVSCKVDLNKMKVRLRGPSEDLKKLDANQLINLLDKYQCQELIINTGEETMRDQKEIRLVYLFHPGNIVMAAGVAMIAFLMNANLCGIERSGKTKFLFNVLYLSSIAVHCGLALWTSFIRGYALKFGLSFDNFHLVDNLLLPKYFSVCVLLSALSLYSFLTTHCVTPYKSWPLEAVAQMIITVLTFFMELIAICYIVPALIKLRDATDDCLFDDEESDQIITDIYEKNLTKLGKLNWTLCLINFLTIIFLSAHMYYITTKLNIGAV